MQDVVIAPFHEIAADDAARKNNRADDWRLKT
jgi:hypothetical protein